MWLTDSSPPGCRPAVEYLAIQSQPRQQVMAVQEQWQQEHKVGPYDATGPGTAPGCVCAR